ncbi:hypothetical protein BH11MYX1_BH11MYX1_08430 [soil metagenome]
MLPRMRAGAPPHDVAMRSLVLALMATACTTGHSDPDPEFYGRPWKLTIVDATISDKKANDWDPDASDPDPYVQVYLDGDLIGKSPTVDDTLDPTWNYAPPVYVISEGETLSLDLLDSDDSSDHGIFRDCKIALNSNAVKLGTVSCPTQLATVKISITVE